MPKLYEYFGLVVFFFANEHTPVHVHGRYQDAEMRAEIIIENGTVIEIRIVAVKGRRPLPPARLADFEALVHHYAGEIVQKWINFFVLGGQVKPTIIRRRIK
jgi:hypothetical protein